MLSLCLCHFRLISSCMLQTTSMLRTHLTDWLYRKRGLRSKSNMFTFVVTLFMFALSTAYWGASVANLVQKIQSILIDPSERSTTNVITYHLLFNAIILINVSSKC